ncbi:MAG: hypothetical protein AYK22_06965 [Thermoplasmatales archaeon SG8-52-3]|nr:MAG: hypothetical protein AYK22_06965 [Thermoplasmatales archaeon SG8-52-3]
MSSFCPNCGTKLDEGFKFCLNCGAKLNIGNANDPIDPKQKIEQKSVQNQSDTNDSIKPVSESNKSNRTLLFLLIAIIAIILIVIIINLSIGGLDNRFIGEWEISDGGVDEFYWIFNDDRTLTMIISGFDMDIASWSVRGTQLCLNMKENELWGDFLPQGYEDEICFDFVFSNEDNTVSLSIEGSENFVLTKK